MFEKSFVFFRGPNVKILAGAMLGSGALYLRQEVDKYKSLETSFAKHYPQAPKTPHRIVTPSGSKDAWLIIGRQSPGFARDPEKHPKDTQKKDIEQSKIPIKKLGATLDNERHYHLLPWSNFQVELFSSNPDSVIVVVDPAAMLKYELQDIPDGARFEVGIAKKPAFSDFLGRDCPLNLSHLALALRVVPEGEEPKDGCVVMSGAEIKRIINKTNKNICETQHCDLYSSNCQSASIYAVGEMIKVINKRPEDNPTKDADIETIASHLKAIAFTNMSRGVSNNPVVAHQVTYTIPKVLKESQLRKEQADTKDSALSSGASMP